MLVLAQRLGYRLAEVAINWHEIPGSKVRLLPDGWKMISGLMKLRRTCFRWKQKEPLSNNSSSCSAV